MNLKKEADLIEEQGRYGDTELVHLNPMEVKWLEKMVPEGKDYINPVTGKKEFIWPAIIMAIATVASTGASIAAGKKRQKEAEKAAQEGAYIEGSAPIIPTSNQMEIETIGEAAPDAAGMAPDFREALEGSYGGGMYETQDFQNEQIPPELLEMLMQQQQSAGADPTNVQFANSGGPVGLPEDVYNFPVEKISQMQMDVDPGVRNVGNAMMAQMEANPEMGMVGASAADIDQMAAGGPVRPKKYQDGSEGGVEGTGVLALLEQLLPPDREHMAVDEYDSDGNLIERSITYSSSKEGDPLVSKARTEADVNREVAEYLSNDDERYSGMGGPSLSEIIPRYEQRRIPQKSDFPLRRQAEIAMGLESILKNSEVPPRLDEMLRFVNAETQEGRVLSDRDLKFMQMQIDQERMFNEFLETEAPMATGGPVQPRRYQDGDQVKGTDQSLSELKQMAKSRGISRIEELLGFRLPEGLGEQDIEDVLLNAGLGELGIPITKRGDNYSYARKLGEDSNINLSVNPDQKAVQLGFEKRFNTGGPVQPRRYDDGGVIQEAIVDTVTNQIPGVSQAKILQAIKQTDDPEEKRRLARQLIPGYGLGEMGVQGVKALGSRIRERRANRREEAPVLGPR